MFHKLLLISAPKFGKVPDDAKICHSQIRGNSQALTCSSRTRPQRARVCTTGYCCWTLRTSTPFCSASKTPFPWFFALFKSADNLGSQIECFFLLTAQKNKFLKQSIISEGGFTPRKRLVLTQRHGVQTQHLYFHTGHKMQQAAFCALNDNIVFYGDIHTKKCEDVPLGVLCVEMLEMVSTRNTRLLPSCVWYENALMDYLHPATDLRQLHLWIPKFVVEFQNEHSTICIQRTIPA